MKRNIVCILISLLFTAGCSAQPEKTDVISVNLSKMNSPVCVIENVIPLETTNDVLVGKNYTIQTTSQYYIVGDHHKIIVFSKQGQSKTVLSPLGNGPNELAYIDFYYAGDTSIMIMDIKNRIMEFDYNGRFLKSHPVNALYRIFACFNDFYLFDNQTPSTAKGNVLSIAGRTGKIIKDTIPVIAEGVNYGRNKFQIFKNYALYLPTMSNIIYKIDKSANVFPAYQLDFGKYWQDAKTCNRVIADSKGDAFALWKYLAKYDRIGFLSYFDTREWLFLNFEKRDRRYNWYYNKESKKQYLLECDGSSVAALDIIGVENNKFIAVLEAADYLNSTVTPKLDNLPEDNNPVFVIFNINEQ
ncbi:MAG: 6-bladed beta-propeller [Bacteroidales bacterium]|jgi:hypothetical protein|nr:6-bladed beta-propeller [Bacteroidales bacterium]